jgi:GNAT superfamily N-acetyltransferase
MLWKGIPTDLAPALDFFRARGCVFTETIVDQYRDVEAFRYPETIDADMRRQGLRLHRLAKTDAARVVDFERKHFPHWAEYFESYIDEGRYTEIVCLSSASGLVGAALLGRPGTIFPGSQWSALARRGLGMYATLGIAPAHRGRGFGYALSAFATRCVQDDGAAVCFINQSDAVPLYRKLGFLDWAEYQAAEIAR